MVSVTLSSAIGDRIIQLRRDRGWSQGQLASFAGVNQAWLSKVESGERQRPAAALLARVARAFGVSVDLLITGQDATAPAETDDLDRLIDETWNEYDELAQRAEAIARRLRDLMRRRGRGPRPA